MNLRKLLLALTSVLVLFCVVALAGSDEASPETKAKEKSAKKKGVKLPPCAACAALVASFEAGIKRTARGNLAGGDTRYYLVHSIQLANIQQSYYKKYAYSICYRVRLESQNIC